MRTGIEIPSLQVTLIPDMSAHLQNLKAILAAIMAIVMYSIPLSAQDAGTAQPPRDLSALYAELGRADENSYLQLEREIALEWRRSGSVTVDLLLRRGTDALERGDYPAAIDHFTALTDHAPDFASGWYGRARAFFLSEQWGVAISDLEHALAIDPNHFEALYALAAILEQTDHPRKALKAYQLALAIHPHYEDAKEGIARLKPKLGGHDL